MPRREGLTCRANGRLIGVKGDGMDVSNLIVGGDTHGKCKQLTYLYRVAIEYSADAIFIVGDFGYWEHTEKGLDFLRHVEHLAHVSGIPLFWLDGNHENHTMLHQFYGDAKTEDGFWVIRDGIYYAPRGHRWIWSGRHCMSLGGGYSIDKSERLWREANGFEDREKVFHPPTGPLTAWWPDEELTDDDVAYALRDTTPLDLLLAHDKPRASNCPGIDPNILECLPNQDRVMRVVRELHPKLLIHGHLHVRYTDEIRNGLGWTTVMGLAAERQPANSWVHLTLPAEKDSRDRVAQGVA